MQSPTFAALTDVLMGITQIRGQNATQRRTSQLRAFVHTLKNTADPQQSLTALLHLIIPTVHKSPRANILTAKGIGALWLSLATENSLLPNQTNPPDNNTINSTKQWPNPSIEKTIQDVRDRTRDTLYVADISNVASYLCPYVPDRETKHNNTRSTQTLQQVADLVEQMRMARTAAQQRNILREFATDNGNTDANEYPHSLQWQWFTRIVLETLYIQMQETTVLYALHPMAHHSARLQHDLDKIAQSFMDGGRFPYATAPGTPFQPARCERMLSYPLIPYSFTPQYMQNQVLTNTRTQNALFKDRRGKWMFRHEDYMDEFFDVMIPPMDAQQTLGDSWVDVLDRILNLPTDQVPQLTAKAIDNQPETKFRKHITILFHHLVLHQILRHATNISSWKKRHGFRYFLMGFDPSTDYFQDLPTARMWDILRNGPSPALKSTDQVALLPTLPLVQNNIGVGFRTTNKPSGSQTRTLQSWVTDVNAKISQEAQVPKFFMQADAIANKEVHEQVPKERGFIVEEKYDGDRMQFHLLDDGTTHMFTRNGFNRNTMYAPVLNDLKSALASDVKSVILDGELLAYNTLSQSYTPWGSNQILATVELDTVQNLTTINAVTLSPSSILMEHDSASYLQDGAMEMPSRTEAFPRFMEKQSLHTNLPVNAKLVHLQNTQLCFMIFDVLHLNGTDVLHLPLYARKRLLDERVLPLANHIPGRIQTTKTNYANTAMDVFEMLKAVVENRGEGLVVKNPYTPYIPGTSVQWQKIKPHCDDIDTVIVGFGFQLAKDLFSTGNPHISSFTVAVKQTKTAPKKNDSPYILHTICEIPWMRGNAKANENTKIAYITHPTAILTRVILDALQNVASGAETRIRDFDECTLWATSFRNQKKISLRWETKPTAPYPNRNSRVVYDHNFTNVQIVANPFLFERCMAVRGDYRIKDPFLLKGASRFTAKYTIRFPRGTVRPMADKHPIDCDSINDVDEIAKHSAQHLILQNLRSLVNPLRQDMAGLVLSDGGAQSISNDAATPTTWILNTLTILGGNARVRNATDAQLDSIMQSLDTVKWPEPLRKLTKPQNLPDIQNDNNIVNEIMDPPQYLSDSMDDNSTDDDIAPSSNVDVNPAPPPINDQPRRAVPLKKPTKPRYQNLHHRYQFMQEFDILVEKMQIILRRVAKRKIRNQPIQIAQPLVSIPLIHLT